MKRLVIGLVTAFVLFVLFVVLCTYVRRPYEKVLLTRFGKLVPEENQTRIMYNWYFKLPTDGVVRVDTRLHLYPGMLQEAATKGKEVISLQTFAAWRIVDPEKFYKTINADDEKAMGILDTKIRGLVLAKLGSHTLDELYNEDETKLHTTEIENEVAREATLGSADGMTQITFTLHADPASRYPDIEALRKLVSDLGRSDPLLSALQSARVSAVGNASEHRFEIQTTIKNPPGDSTFVAEKLVKPLTEKLSDVLDKKDVAVIINEGMRDLGIEIAEVGFSRMGFSPRTAPFVYLRMSEQLKLQASDFSARGKAKYDEIVAQGDQAAKETIAKATIQAATIRGVADSTALTLTAEFQKTPADAEFYQFWRGLEFLKASFTRNTVYVMSSKSWLLKSINPSFNSVPPPTTMPGTIVIPETAPPQPK